MGCNDVTIKDGQRNTRTAKVTDKGQLVVAPLDFSTSATQVLAIDDTGYTLYGPQPNKVFIITGIIFSAENTTVGLNGALVELFEADAANVATVSRSIIQLVVPRGGSVALTGLNLETSTGKWLNAKTDDNNIYITVLGYYA
jgi:hypothetical protein